MESRSTGPRFKPNEPLDRATAWRMKDRNALTLGFRFKTNESGYMVQVISYLFIAFILASSVCDGVPAVVSSPDASGTRMVASSNSDTNNTTDPIASNAAILKKLSLSSATPQAETVFVIGESAISRTTKNLANLSKEAKGQELADGSKLAGLYSEMGSAFSATSIPIKLFKYDPQIPQLPQDLFPGLAYDPNEPARYYFEPGPTSLPVSDLPSGNKESKGGVTVIWNP